MCCIPMKSEKKTSASTVVAKTTHQESVLTGQISIERNQGQYLVYPLGQGPAIVRLQPTHAYSTSALSQYKPLLLYIPHFTCTQQHRLQ